jgi:hypothetical protein
LLSTRINGCSQDALTILLILGEATPNARQPASIRIQEVEAGIDTLSADILVQLVLPLDGAPLIDQFLKRGQRALVKRELVIRGGNQPDFP